MGTRERSTTNWLVWSIAFLTLFILAIFAYAITKERNKKQQVENEINALKEEAEKIKKENMNLEDRLAYLGSEDYQKMQAKEKLNLQSPGENVVVIAPSLIKKEEAPSQTNATRHEKEADAPNYLKWYDYFFKK